jgi:Ca2+-transporting ATPase
MARRQVLLRRLQAINTLGAASVICTDKTGTLTENRMTAVEVRAAGRRYEVTGTGYDPAGRILHEGQPVRAGHDANLQRLLHAGLVCNNARLEPGRNWRMHGDPTEGALVTLAYKGWTPLPDPGDRMAETPFTSERKRMGMLARRPDGTMAFFVKGAPEAVLATSTRALGADGEVPLDADLAAHLLAEAEEMSAEGLRVIAVADRDASGPQDTGEEGLVFLGFAGLLDPPREEVAGAVALCHAAGIRVVMITGDSPVTARAIAGRVGIRNETVIAGAELDVMSDEALARALEQDVLFARTTPVHKLRIVERLQQAGGIVAMTGDGVNDAPALRRADIGMAMGERGTDVAKEAADLVILDDNFATIVHAIEEGRRQFANIRKFVRYLLSSNSAEVIALAINLAIGGPLVLLPVHLLWINLLTDGVSAVALGLEPAEAQQMQRLPLDRDERVLTADGITGLAAFGIYMGAVCAAVFYLYLPEGEALARTMAFTTLVACQEVAVFAFRSDRRPAVALGFLSNRWLLVAVAGMLLLQGLAIYWPPLQALMGTVPLGAAELGVVFLAALPVILVPTAFKLVRRWRGYSLT